MDFICLKLGLILNLLGTILVALSFGKNLEEAHQIDKKGRRIYLASFLHPSWFKAGMFLIILGFLLSIIF